MVGSYVVGDVWALVPARKAVWSLPGKPKTPGKTFFIQLFFALSLHYISLHTDLFPLSFYFMSHIIIYIFFCLTLFSIISSFMRYH